MEQAAGQAVVVVHHVLAIALHRVTAGALMEHGLDLTVMALGETVKPDFQIPTSSRSQLSCQSSGRARVFTWAWRSV